MNSLSEPRCTSALDVGARAMLVALVALGLAACTGASAEPAPPFVPTTSISSTTALEHDQPITSPGAAPDPTSTLDIGEDDTEQAIPDAHVSLRTVVTAQPTAAPSPTDGLSLWIGIGQGVEERALVIPAKWPSVQAPAVIVRVDPAQASVTMHYNRGAPARVAEWNARLSALSALRMTTSPEPYVVINAGYFQEDFTTAGLIVEDGRRFGDSFGPTPGHAEGMFSLVGLAPRIWSLAREPYNPAEPLDQAVQGLPMLVDGGAAADFAIADHAAKRTAIAMDGQGRLLLINVPNSVTLLRLRGWLLEQQDLGIVTALNLDGGSSAGMVIPGGPVPIHNDSGKAVPAVLAVTARP